MNKLAFITLPLFVAAGAPLGWSQSEKRVVDAPTVTLPLELDRVLRDYERAWRAHDANALAGLFAEDGYVLSNGAAPVKGRDAIRVAYANAGGALDLRAFYYSTEGNVGFILGAYRHGPSTPETGKFTLALRRDATGRWLIVADMDNSNESRASAPQPSAMAQPKKPTASATLTQWLKNDRWSMGEADATAGKFMVRWRTPVLAAGDVAGYDQRLSVLWPYAPQGAGSLPTSDEGSAMAKFEDRLCAALEGDASAVLTAVVTGDGARQWVFYTGDVDECRKRLAPLLHPDEKHSIELTTESDPGWSFLREQVLRRFEKKHE
ncbi:MAG: SgcJ/EcaC family oxidoreductase [Planctomycetes bacterium]|nr:SgcJ/EcaC family oxidoreductase [Planctomycetota bacterium]MBI3843795.1 SgcJ/EcaC family oxidoreductase [Planctomycetota bacterium]